MTRHLPLVDFTDTTFLGIVSSDGLFTGQQLSDILGITEGTLHNNDCGWLHFYVGKNATCNKTGKAYEIYVAKKTIRHSISWVHINAKNGVTGKDVIANNGITYTCRLLTGADANPSTKNDGMGSEWNNLIYRVHSEIIKEDNGNKQIGENWVDMSDTELGVNYLTAPNGSFSWCQEHYNTATRVFRGYVSVSGFDGSNPAVAYTYSGWRPVLVRVL